MPVNPDFAIPIAPDVEGVYVPQAQFAIYTPTGGGDTTRLKTFGIASCVGLVMRDSASGKTFVAHFDEVSEGNVREAVEGILDVFFNIQPTDAWIVGPNVNSLPGSGRLKDGMIAALENLPVGVNIMIDHRNDAVMIRAGNGVVRRFANFMDTHLDVMPAGIILGVLQQGNIPFTLTL